MHIKISNNIISAKIDTKGAELFELKSNNKNYIWGINKQYWDKTSPILFPIIGKLKEDHYNLNGKKYHLPRHGFARDYEFQIKTQEESSVEFVLHDNEKTFQNFPFEFELSLKYSIIENKLVKKYRIINLSQQIMPFSIGAHPAFAIDLKKAKYNINFNNTEQIKNYLLENELFSGQTNEIILTKTALELNYSLFETDAIVLKNLKAREITIFENNSPFLKLDLGNFPHLGIWTKKGAPFLCIEPWSGYADNTKSNGNIFEKEAIKILEPQKTFTTYYSIEIL